MQGPRRSGRGGRGHRLDATGGGEDLDGTLVAGADDFGGDLLRREAVGVNGPVAEGVEVLARGLEFRDAGERVVGGEERAVELLRIAACG